ncbi:hypothetical protein Niako_4602 [Niastella koreensis GR20-10]|uniref:Uncharacterized protein n=1 Tax=Niastella koreensis (strain DSM 17620 / KACC 11465 / NBRC 106392 / GR20-10) TaxID=700598 RepID=G8TL21_NIAKG|nr:hypothetical protein Niako_4602 [Niastella koreensis GR20-10]
MQIKRGCIRQAEDASSYNVKEAIANYYATLATANSGCSAAVSGNRYQQTPSRKQAYSSLLYLLADSEAKEGASTMSHTANGMVTVCSNTTSCELFCNV